MKGRCATNSITLDMVPIGMLRSVGLLGDKAHRDMQIEQTCDQNRLAAKGFMLPVSILPCLFVVFRDILSALCGFYVFPDVDFN